LEKSAGTVLI